ncbi:MAG: hypothetical protein E6R03_16545 [Hyphomicrobiaceae bacterium]|nr:MAG: hypothetical protein E6R03_16545 [Hyphomicrobiaceae bacterium]
MNTPRSNCHRCGEICCRCWRFKPLLAAMLLVCTSAAAQPKGAQLLMTQAPAIQSVGVSSPMLIRAAVAPAPYQDRGAIQFYWKPGTSNWPLKFRVLYSHAGVTNSLVTDKTNVTLRGLVEGVTYQLAVSSFVEGQPLSETALISTNATTYFWGEGFQSTWTYRTRGRAGSTNLVETSTNLTTWTEAARFQGTGAVTNFVFPLQDKQFFRTRAL